MVTDCEKDQQANCLKSDQGYNGAVATTSLLLAQAPSPLKISIADAGAGSVPTSIVNCTTPACALLLLHEAMSGVRPRSSVTSGSSRWRCSDGTLHFRYRVRVSRTSDSLSHGQLDFGLFSCTEELTLYCSMANSYHECLPHEKLKLGRNRGVTRPSGAETPPKKSPNMTPIYISYPGFLSR